MAILSRIPDLISIYREFTEMPNGAALDTSGGIAVMAGIGLTGLAVGCVLMSTRELIPAKVGSD